jgi:Spx/MgsR family transcriptional regulator
MSVTFVGLKNCDTCKKARAWLDGAGIDYLYRDVRADGLTAADVETWMAGHSDWQIFVNRRGTTWRGLAEADTRDLDQGRAAALIAANPTLMKRPVMIIEKNGKTTVTVGFNAEIQDELKQLSA